MARQVVDAAARTADLHGRIILDIEWVPTPGGEAAHRHGLLHPPRPACPGAQGVIYDTALRGVHHQTPAARPRLLPINRVTAAKAGAKKPRRNDGNASRRASTSRTRPSRSPTARPRPSRLYARDGALGIAELTDTGDLALHAHSAASAPTATPTRTAGTAGTTTTDSPTATAAGRITVRLHGNDDDHARKLNRTENLRPIPPGDPDFERLYPRRNDAESINRDLDDTLWLGRAHSLGHARQHLNLLGYALMVNSLALHRPPRTRQHRHSPPEPPLEPATR